MTDQTQTPTFLAHVGLLLELQDAIQRQEVLARLPAAMAQHPALDPGAFEQARRALQADAVLGWRSTTDLERLERAGAQVTLAQLAHLRERARRAVEVLPELRRRYHQVTVQLWRLVRASVQASRQQGASEDEIGAAALTLASFLQAHGSPSARPGVEPLV